MDLGERQHDRLIGTWLHSHEEDRDDDMIYRSEAYPFPPSRGRAGVMLAKDGGAKLIGPGADDRTRSRAARWSLDGDRVRIEHEGGVLVFEVVVQAGADPVLKRRQGS